MTIEQKIIRAKGVYRSRNSPTKAAGWLCRRSAARSHGTSKTRLAACHRGVGVWPGPGVSELKKRGLTVSPAGFRCVWLRHGGMC